MPNANDMNHFIKECESRGWWGGTEENATRSWYERWCCELVENYQHRMPHAYICGYGPNRDAAIADAARQLGMFLWEDEESNGK